VSSSSSASTPRVTRKTFRERQAELEVSIQKKANSHDSGRKRKRSFGSSNLGSPVGMADRVVERMKKVVSYEKREVVHEEKLVWTRVEL
jgi:hypothetical protein